MGGEPLKKVVIAFHGHCFDGMCSAAVFTRFLRQYEKAELDISYRGLDHQSGGSYVPEKVLSGEINAVVDFRYTTSPRLTWWFDHHVSGIAGEEEMRHFRQDKSGRKFFDPGKSSCCGLIEEVASTRFGIRLPELEQIVRWADIIDSASFPDARTAVELKEPALQLMTVVEAYGNETFLSERIERLAGGISLQELAAEPGVQKLFQPLFEVHERTCQAIREKAEFSSGVVAFDLIGSGSDRYNKFIPYWIYPDASYCVAVLASRTRAKVSVGSNPWATRPRVHDIARICAEYGGGGHPAVGAVSLRPDQTERARQIGKEIAGRLRASAVPAPESG
jgi:hypothetical protein